MKSYTCKKHKDKHQWIIEEKKKKQIQKPRLSLMNIKVFET